MGKYSDTMQGALRWCDRRRHCGLPVSFTQYLLDDERLYVKAGLLRSTTSEMLLYRVLDINSVRTLWQKIVGVGDVVLHAADRSDPVLTLKSIARPDEVRKMISRMVEEARIAHSLRGREMYGVASMDRDDGMDVGVCQEDHGVF